MPRMTGDRARECFTRARIARLATVDDAGRPHLVPAVFALTGDTVVFAVDHKPKRSADLKRLANIRAHPEVCLLVDGYDEDWDRLWWARADGTAAVLPPAERSAASARYVTLLTRKYRQNYADRPPQGPVVEIQVARWSGWYAA
ncbi:TIGR03668 family PPOX class F420-dependent oxidoreductase [Streptomyces libani]|uniref:TIGR03668 family PPOX class F420-dependent oxidoreductase n=2 Tax=Streptomyces nigrescens TaxID=1920 RepID=A0ABY7IUU8_STRNI|nr:MULTISPECIES: TIGR03668 family PPOX class F420-dependent oxidoreductase [Streptomyces]MYT11273.1 TIGR03668 family PPOX class F420-dependent oxidoreductase [Streptomyces sp. SID4951]AWN25159.1 TIGR03668 family PPOX class F420-dependent oxidoreductase [Streptomyces sp. NEAU-S7GS2]MCX5444299.1 TIGR03668 family PPOX class F420-dependent oxidoreductase [Streptomyces libani]WAU01356.1 TIGR03668 family PPOX class F420-dependent oxidoreductase [Streptomyces libani subsp. libani]WDT52791.1 TIGR03668